LGKDFVTCSVPQNVIKDYIVGGAVAGVGNSNLEIDAATNGHYSTGIIFFSNL